MSTQEKKSALKIGYRKSTESEIYGIPKSLAVIWVSPFNMAIVIFLVIPFTVETAERKKNEPC